MPVLDRFETVAERSVFVGLLTVLVGAVVIAIASVVTQIGAPSPGFVVWQNLIVPAIGPISAAPEAADVPQRSVVVAVDGEPLADASDLRRRLAAAPSGTRVAYAFVRGGERLAATVPTSILRWRSVAAVYLPYLVEGVGLLATAIVVFLFRPRAPAARAAMALGLTSGLMQLLALDLFSAAWLERVYFCAESMVPAALLHFALSFPEEKDVVRRRRWIVPALYVACVPFAALQNVFLTTDPARHLSVNSWVYAADGLAGVASMALLVHGFVTARTALARQQAKVVLTGMVAVILVPALGLLAIVVAGLDLPMSALTPFLLLYPASIAYAVVRHDLFHVDRWLRLGVVWAILTVVVFLSYAGVALAGQAFLGAGGHGPNLLVPLYVVTMLLVANPLRGRIQRGVDRLFYRQRYDHRATVDATSRALASVLDTDRIAATVLRTLTDVMAAEWAVLVVHVDAAAAPRVYGQPTARGADAVRLLHDGDAELAGLDAQVRLPLRFEARPVGRLLVGAKLSGAFYGEDDLALLATLANQSALALVNAHAADVIRQTQSELAEAERLAAVGELASAVAHGIRNPLAGIRSSAEVAREDAAPELRESLDDIIGEADRLETRVRTILDFTRPMTLEPVPGDLATFLRGFADEFRRRVPAGVRVDVDVAPALPAVAFDRSALGEVVETIAVNALEAMPATGTITLRATLEPHDGTGVDAVVSVCDTGPGMDAATARRVFDLFYTTKTAGTGVGLAMAKRLVERQGGTIAVESAPGAGATFRIRLPLAAPLSARTS
jgi:signal transduction histidine kinase